MHWLTLNCLLRAERGMQKADLYGQIAAIHKAQAVIEFDLQGHVLMANQNFLDTMGYSRTRSWDSITACSYVPKNVIPRPTQNSGTNWDRAPTTPAVIAACARTAPISGCKPPTVRSVTSAVAR